MGVIIGRGGKAIHIEGPGGGGDATLCGMGADYIKGTDAAVTCKKCLAKAAKLEAQAPELHPSQVREITVHEFETINTRIKDGVLVQVQVAYGDDGAPLATRYVPVEQAPEAATVITHNCGLHGPRSAACCDGSYAALRDGSRMFPASELSEHVITFAEVRTGDIVGSLGDPHWSAWWTVAGLSDDGSRVHLVSWDGTSMGHWALGDLVTVLRPVCQHPAESKRFAYTASERVVWCHGCGEELVRERTAARFTTYGRKRKGCKWDRRRSNSRMRKVARA